MGNLTHIALTLALTWIQQPAFSDDFSEEVQKALIEYFDVRNAQSIAQSLAADPQLKGQASSGAAADQFAKLLESKTPQKLAELEITSNRKLLRDSLEGGEASFTRHLKLAAGEALKIIDGKRRPIDPRQDDNGTFLNEFADTYSQLVSPRLDELKELRRQQQKEDLFARSPQSKPRKPTEIEDPLGQPHLKKPRKKRLPAPEETEAAKHWAKYGNATPRQIEDWLIDINTAGPAATADREKAARAFLKTFSAPDDSSKGILGRATSKNLSGAARWKQFGLKEVGFETLRGLHDLATETDVSKLRTAAYGEANSGSARDELLRRVNQSDEQDPLGAAMRSDFKHMRPELLLTHQDAVAGSDRQAAKAFATLLGSSNTRHLKDLANKGERSGSGASALASYDERLRCAAALLLQSRDQFGDDKIPCEGKASFGEAFKKALETEKERFQLYQNWIETAKNAEDLSGARAWFLDPNKSGYTAENLMDRLGERVQTALDVRLSVPERQAAHDEAITLAKILGHQDVATGEWSLDLIARDAGFSPKTPTSQSLILGKGDEIFAALARFTRRDTANHAVETSTKFGSRSRLQSFTRDERPHTDHLRDKNTVVYYAPEGEDKKDSLGLGAIVSDRPNNIGLRAKLVPTKLKPFKLGAGPSPVTNTSLEQKVRDILSSRTCTSCHGVAKSVADLQRFFASSGFEGTMSGGPSLQQALAGNPDDLATLRQFLAPSAR